MVTTGFQELSLGVTVAKISYQHKHDYQYDKVKINAADFEYEGINHIHQEGSDISNLLTISNDGSIVVFTASSWLSDQLKSNYEKCDEAAISCERTYENLDIKEGKITAQASHYAKLEEVFSEELVTDHQGAMDMFEHSYSYVGVKIDTKINAGKISSSTHSFAKNEDIANSIDLTRYTNQARLDHTLSIEDAKREAESLFIDFPVLNAKPVAQITSNKVSSINDVLLNSLYSYKADAANVIKNIKYDINHSSKFLFGDVFTIIALDLAKYNSSVVSKAHQFAADSSVYVLERNEPFRLIYETNEEIRQQRKLIDVGGEKEIGGFYRPLVNLITFQGDVELVHEATHACLHMLFANDALPYPKEKDKIQEKYNQAEKELLSNIASKLGYSDEEAKFSDDKWYNNYFFLNLPLVDLLYRAQESDLNYFEELELKDKLNEYNISYEKAHLMSDIINVLQNYGTKDFSIELLPIMVQKYQEGFNQDILDDIFSPLLSYWDEHIHPQVMTKIEEHRNECENHNETNYLGSNNYAFCIEEIL